MYSWCHSNQKEGKPEYSCGLQDVFKGLPAKGQGSGVKSTFRFRFRSEVDAVDNRR